MCDIGTVNNIEFSLNFSIGIQFYFPFSYFLVLARENHNNILSFFFPFQKRRLSRDIVIYIFISTIREAFPSLFESRKIRG